MTNRHNLNENNDLPSTIQALIHDIGTPITMLFDALDDSARRYASNHDGASDDKYRAANGKLKRDDMSGFTGVRGMLLSRWMATVYTNRMQSHLATLCKQSPKNTKQLHELLHTLPRTYKDIYDGGLPTILIEIGKRLNSPRLVTNARQWIELHDRHIKLCHDLQASNDEYVNQANAHKMRSSGDTPPERDQSTVGKQNAQVEMIISDILKNLPPKVANELRMAIARKDNKLQALQAEMQKRNITLSEAAIQSVKDIVDFDLDKAIAHLTSLYESKIRKSAKKQFPV